MIIVLKQNAPDAQVHEFCRELEGMGLQINDSKGSDTHILGLIGDTKAIAESWVLANPVVETCRRVSEPYKKANRKFHPDDSIIDVNGVKIGGGNFAVIAGPCSIESEEQITYCAQRVKEAGASLLRGGAFKPRTSPYSFQGMRSEGLDLLKLARRATGAPIVTEIMNTEHLPLFENVDLIQVGARNMQNFELLKAVGRQKKPLRDQYAQHAGPGRCGHAPQDDPPAGHRRPQPCLRPRLDGAGAGQGCRSSRGRRPDDRGPQQPRQGQVRRCPEPDPRPVR